VPVIDRPNAASLATAHARPTHLSQASAVTDERADFRIDDKPLLERLIIFIGHELENAASEHRCLNDQHNKGYAIGVAASIRPRRQGSLP